MKRIVFSCFFFLQIISVWASKDFNPDWFPIIPRPQTLIPNGENFSISSSTTVFVATGGDSASAAFLITYFHNFLSIDLTFSKTRIQASQIVFRPAMSTTTSESYVVDVAADSIVIQGASAGSFYAVQTIFQIFKPVYLFSVASGVGEIPGMHLEDRPRFDWRGLHLDVARHFFSVEDVKFLLQQMAFYKLNTFHWHLTDDQGWRIEIKKHPRLTSVGAWRKRTLLGHYSEEPDRYEEKVYGGFYTQEQIREVVAYAQRLHITIVPEIEMPGHALAMLAAYPELGCRTGTYEVAQTWGVFEDVLCPSKKTFAFLDDVLTEVAALFPGTYIHIGGDECPKKQWKESAYCQRLIFQHRLKDENGLQSWFIKKIVSMLQAKGKKAIGWDEILDGGLVDGAAVMSWRGEEGGIAAARAGHPVVMTPTSHCYLDYYQSQQAGEPIAIGGFLPIEKILSYNPIPASLTPEQEKMIVGVQGNLWTEYIASRAHLEYMIFPRIAALAEIAWATPVDPYFFPHFFSRLNSQFARWKAQNIDASQAMFQVSIQTEPTSDFRALQLHAFSFLPNSEYEYALGYDSLPQQYFPLTAPQTLMQDGYFCVRRKAEGQSVFPSTCQVYNYNLATGKPISIRKAPHKNYNHGGAFTLVDGMSGRRPWTGAEWLGFWGDTLDATIDLLEVETVSDISISALHDPGSWIYAPSKIMFYTSVDGKNFVLFDSTGQNVFKGETHDKFGYNMSDGKQARYVRVVVYGAGMIPDGFSGSGYPAWLFIDEIDIR